LEDDPRLELCCEPLCCVPGVVGLTPFDEVLAPDEFEVAVRFEG
jgi:hypothetical protein